MEIKVQSVVIPERKTENVAQWQGYIQAKIREIRGFSKSRIQTTNSNYEK